MDWPRVLAFLCLCLPWLVAGQACDYTSNCTQQYEECFGDSCRCKNGWGGQDCRTCQTTQDNAALCQQCTGTFLNCNFDAGYGDCVCGEMSCVCQCSDPGMNFRCNDCAAGYHGFPNCTATLAPTSAPTAVPTRAPIPCGNHTQCPQGDYCSSSLFCEGCAQVSPNACDAADGNCCSSEFASQCPGDSRDCASFAAPCSSGPPTQNTSVDSAVWVGMNAKTACAGMLSVLRLRFTQFGDQSALQLRGYVDAGPGAQGQRLRLLWSYDLDAVEDVVVGETVSINIAQREIQDGTFLAIAQTDVSQTPLQLDCVSGGARPFWASGSQNHLSHPIGTIMEYNVTASMECYIDYDVVPFPTSAPTTTTPTATPTTSPTATPTTSPTTTAPTTTTPTPAPTQTPTQTPTLSPTLPPSLSLSTEWLELGLGPDMVCRSVVANDVTVMFRCTVAQITTTASLASPIVSIVSFDGQSGAPVRFNESLTFSIPMHADSALLLSEQASGTRKVEECTGGVRVASCEWFDHSQNDWSSDGCHLNGISTAPGNATFAQCTCSHLTEFAILIRSATAKRHLLCATPRMGVDYGWMTCYLLAAVFGVVQLARVLFRSASNTSSRSALLGVHGAIAAACTLRALLLALQPLLPAAVVVLLASLATLLLMGIFAYVVVTWMAVVAFSLLVSPFEQLKPMLVVGMVLLSVVTLAIPVALLAVSEPDAQVALASWGATIFSAVVFLLAVGVIVWGTKLALTLDHAKHTTSTTKSGCSGTSLRNKVIVSCVTLSVSLLTQSTLGVLSIQASQLASASSQSVLTSLYQAAVLLSCVAIFGLFFKAVNRIVASAALDKTKNAMQGGLEM